MCGIAGILALDGFDPTLLISMTDAIKYRGPDGFGFVYFDVASNSAGECFHNQSGFPTRVNPSLGFGTRRLAILDVSESGNQPMQIEDGQYWITYNGEIYNYLEIRAELESSGHSFRTGTDTEVILKAYSEWGRHCVDKFNGMWSFAIWNHRERKLFCSRDRFGIKPFYYFLTDTFLAFGSENKQLLSCPGVRRTINEKIALQYLELGLQDHSTETFFDGIHQLAAGHSLTIEIRGSTLQARTERYWELQIETARKVDEAEALEEFSHLLQRAVRWQMRSDVPLGSCLSGGLDSSSVVSLAARATDRKG